VSLYFDSSMWLASIMHHDRCIVTAGNFRSVEGEKEEREHLHLTKRFGLGPHLPSTPTLYIPSPMHPVDSRVDSSSTKPGRHTLILWVAPFPIAGHMYCMPGRVHKCSALSAHPCSGRHTHTLPPFHSHVLFPASSSPDHQLHGSRQRTSRSHAWGR
jgi:hypothetical protein